MKRLLFIILCCFSHWISIYGARPFITLLASECGANAGTIGLISAAFSAVQVVLALIIGKVMDKKGTRFIMIVGNAILVVSTVILTQTRQIPLIFIASALMGISHIMVMLTAQVLTIGFRKGRERGRAVGLYTFGNSAGIFLGPYFGALLFERLGSNRGFYGVVITSLLSLIFSAFVMNQKRETTERQISLKEIINDRPLFRTVLSGSFVLFVAEVNTTFFPLHGQALNLSVKTIGTVLSTYGMASMLVRPFLGKLVQWLSTYRLMIICMTVGGISMAFFGVVHSAALFLILGAILGSTLGILGPTTMLATANITPEQDRSKVMAIRAMINYFGQATSPLVFGYLVSVISINGIYWVSGAMLASSSFICVKDQE